MSYAQAVGLPNPNISQPARAALARQFVAAGQPEYEQPILLGEFDHSEGLALLALTEAYAQMKTF